MSTTLPAPDAAAPQVPAPREVKPARGPADVAFRRTATAAGLSTLVVLVLIGTFLTLRALPALQAVGLSFLTETRFDAALEVPVFGIAALLYWTGVIAVGGLLLALPVSIASALFITEYAPRRLRSALVGLVDLLAAVPSLVYGLWGLFVLQPFLVGVAKWLSEHNAGLPFLKVEAPLFTSSAFVCAVVVSLMVLPITTSVIREVFASAPPGEKEGALALGATRWGMIRTVVLPFGRGGIVGGAMLGLGRALGETIAVAVIVSATFQITPNILQSGANTVAAHIANSFGEASSGLPLSALLAAGLALFVVTLLVNTLASVVVSRSRSGAGVEI